MKQKILQNFDLKILAVLLSIVIWIIVVNIDDPVKNAQFNDVPITFTNESVLTDQNKVYDVVDGTTNVDVVVTGRRSVIEDLSKENISVIADFQNMNEQGVIPLKVNSNKHSSEMDSMKALVDSVSVKVEASKKIQKVIKIDTIGQPAENYKLGDYYLNLNQVYIEGPQSIIDTIHTAKVQIDVDGASENMSASAPIILYDAVGDVIDTSRLKLNIETISITQEILYTKTVSIACTPGGTVAEGYRTTGRVEISPTDIEIAGKKSVVDGISQITIPSSAVNITDQKSTYKTSIDVTDYLPSGVKLSDTNKNVNVIVYIEKEVENTVEIPLNKISIKNLPTGFKADVLESSDAIKNNKIEVSVIGLAEDVNNISPSDVKLSLNIEDYLKNNNLSVLRDGIINVPLEISLPSGMKTGSDITLKVRITTT